jgi:multidrug efflux system membrane fusion protein
MEFTKSPRYRALRWGIILLIIVAILAAIAYQIVTFLGQPPQRRGRFQDGGNQPVGVARIRRGDIRLTLRALGGVTPLATVTVIPQISGQLISVGFKEGQLVHAGQFLAQIDPRPYQIALEEDEAQLVRDEATLKQAQMDLERYKTLAQQQSIARQTYEDQVWTVKSDQGTVDFDKAQIKSQQLNLVYCRITAPTDGRVGLRLVDPGNYVTPNTTSGIVVLTQLTPTTVEYAVPEDAVPQIQKRIHSGAKLPVTAFDRANVTQLATGEFSAIDTEVNTTTGTVMLRATFQNDDGALFPNQFVNVVMLLDTLQGVVTVPVAAVQRGAPGTYVYLVDESNIVSVHPITLGAQDGDFYAVDSGLSPGDRVVTDGADRLRDGAKVSIPDNSHPPAKNDAGAPRDRQPGGREHGNGPHRHHGQPGDEQQQPGQPGQQGQPGQPQGDSQQAPPRHAPAPAGGASNGGT